MPDTKAGGGGGEGAHALGDVDREQAVNHSWPTLQPATQIETEQRQNGVLIKIE